jgi:hypothetical protein
MKVAMALVLLWGLLVGQSARAEQARLPHIVRARTEFNLAKERSRVMRGRT